MNAFMLGLACQFNYFMFTWDVIIFFLPTHVGMLAICVRMLAIASRSFHPLAMYLHAYTFCLGVCVDVRMREKERERCDIEKQVSSATREDKEVISYD